MDKDTAIQEIRHLLSTADMEGALLKTRQLLQRMNAEGEIVQLDMIQSEWHDVRAQTRNGLLDVDDQVRLNNISRAKLLELVLHVGGDAELTENLNLREPDAVIQSRPETGTHQRLNQTFKNGVKNFFGVLFLLAAGGTFMQGHALPGSFLILCGIVTFVPTLQLIEKLLGFPLHSWHKYVILIGGLLAYGLTLPPKAQTGAATEVRGK